MENRLVLVYKKALVNKPAFDSLVSKVAKQSGAKPISNFKNPTTTVSKTAEKNEEDPGRNYQLEDVNDISRARLVYGSLDSMKQGIDAFKQNAKKSSLKIVKEDNYFQKPQDGYKGYHIDVKFPNGQVSEVQFHTANSYASTLATHEVHAQYGDETPPQQVEQQKKQAINTISSMNPQQAMDIAGQIEQKNAPAQQAAQVNALNVAANARSPLVTPEVFQAAQTFRSLKGQYGV